MFSLLITVMAIALVIVLVIATMYYGGSDSVSRGRDEALAASGANEITQIQSSLHAYQAIKGEWPESINDLVDSRMMKSLPKGWGESSVGDTGGSRMLDIEEGERSELICKMINVRMKVQDDDMGRDDKGGLTVGTPPPNCSEVSSGFAGCCLEN